MACAVCGRDARGYGFAWPAGTGKRRGACSILCLDILTVMGGEVMQLTHYEERALDEASDAAGAHLEQIGKTDLATMTKDEWRDLLRIVFVRSTATVQRLADEGAVPF